MQPVTEELHFASRHPALRAARPGPLDPAAPLSFVIQRMREQAEAPQLNQKPWQVPGGRGVVRKQEDCAAESCSQRPVDAWRAADVAPICRAQIETSAGSDDRRFEVAMRRPEPDGARCTGGHQRANSGIEIGPDLRFAERAVVTVRPTVNTNRAPGGNDRLDQFGVRGRPLAGAKNVADAPAADSASRMSGVVVSSGASLKVRQIWPVTGGRGGNGAG